jgi:hypothetical protein
MKPNFVGRVEFENCTKGTALLNPLAFPSSAVPDQTGIGLCFSGKLTPSVRRRRRVSRNRPRRGRDFFGWSAAEVVDKKKGGQIRAVGYVCMVV